VRCYREGFLNVLDCSTKQVGDVNYLLNNPAGDTHKLAFFIMCSPTAEHRLRAAVHLAALLEWMCVIIFTASAIYFVLKWSGRARTRIAA